MDEDFLIRFWSKVDVRGENECWNWKASGRGTGYGCVKLDGEVVDSHRVAYIIANGSIPDGLWVLHKCNNRLCCNPNHLYAGDRSDNSRDSWNAGTSALIHAKRPRGSAAGSSKLSEQDVISIREKISKGQTQSSIAKEYGVSRDTIYWIVSGRSWSWL